jgi:hypothetical protein
MMKRLVVWAMVALVALAAVTPALAAGDGQVGPGGRDQQFFSAKGTITDIGVDTITIKVLGGTGAVWPYIGDELTVAVNDGTVYLRWTGDGRESISFADLAIGNMTNIRGAVAEDGFTADQVTVDVVCP